MEDTSIVFLALGLGVPAMFALIIGIILFAGRSRPQPGLGPRLTGAGGRSPEGTWNALILGDSVFAAMGGTLGSRAGRFHVEQGALSFVADGEERPEWTVPCSQFSARAHSAFNTSGVMLWMPQAQLRCNVSRESINRHTRNTIKSLREAGYYREFVDVLVASGAREV